MIATILLSFGVLFVAELGDKSQLMALTFALRYRWWIVLSGIAVASVAVNLIAVAVGHFLGAALPTNLIALLTALILLGVGVWTLRETRTPESEEQPRPVPAPHSGRALFVVISAFLLAELGDRTMFATIALASQHGWLAVWLGSVAGMVAAGGLAIGVGITVGKHIPERAIAVGSGLLFLYIGAATLLSTLEMGRPLEIGLAAIAPIVAAATLWLLGRRARALATDSAATLAEATEPSRP
ncbi:TMEM165/GDT1 family protein [Nocardia sp. CDC159]|uniref:GDT1 family protein n=1 Tax=Nocardia pulmonis TaxID=2951408 RepID=A0A9X2J1E0_9NOCA|nr:MULTISPECIES: TMEM165/GDT1 family protein [Nocardia]MCM6776906.1 TMEM165/GDT1 family protein [Nocardia pulmonis]MCM6789330.1 TMEM165/GDT1 family protein [Nocardia sp. CDC159]